MKLLLQRTLNHHLEGPFWLESAYVDDGRMHAYLILMRDRDSHFEPRYGPGGEVYWISDKEEIPKVYRQNAKTALTARPTFKFGFQEQAMVTLESRDPDSPYELCYQDQLLPLDNSLTHLDRIPGSQDWLVSSLDTLYRGCLERLETVGPTPARRFSAGPAHFYYTRRHELIQHPYAGQPESIFACQEGSLVYPLYTPQGILVTQEDCPEHHLWLVNPQTKEASSLWNGPDEWVYACDFTGRT